MIGSPAVFSSRSMRALGWDGTCSMRSAGCTPPGGHMTDPSARDRSTTEIRRYLVVSARPFGCARSACPRRASMSLSSKGEPPAARLHRALPAYDLPYRDRRLFDRARAAAARLLGLPRVELQVVRQRHDGPHTPDDMPFSGRGDACGRGRDQRVGRQSYRSAIRPAWQVLRRTRRLVDRYKIWSRTTGWS